MARLRRVAEILGVPQSVSRMGARRTSALDRLNDLMRKCSKKANIFYDPDQPRTERLRALEVAAEDNVQLANAKMSQAFPSGFPSASATAHGPTLPSRTSSPEEIAATTAQATTLGILSALGAASTSSASSASHKVSKRGVRTKPASPKNAHRADSRGRGRSHSHAATSPSRTQPVARFPIGAARAAPTAISIPGQMVNGTFVPTNPHGARHSHHGPSGSKRARGSATEGDVSPFKLSRHSARH